MQLDAKQALRSIAILWFSVCHYLIVTMDHVVIINIQTGFVKNCFYFFFKFKDGKTIITCIILHWEDDPNYTKFYFAYKMCKNIFSFVLFSKMETDFLPPWLLKEYMLNATFHIVLDILNKIKIIPVLTVISIWLFLLWT